MSAVRTLTLFVALALLFAVVGWVVGGFFAGDPYTGSLVFLLLAAAINFASYFFSDKIVLRVTRARIVEPHEAPDLHRIVERLAQRADIPKPRVAIMPSQQPNAFATGRNPNNAVVAATEGILRMLDERELEGVLAHELSHVQNRDVLTMSAAATVAGAITFAARAGLYGGMFGGGHDRGGNPLALLAMALLAPIAAMLVQLAISRGREFAADADGARLTHDPISLANALRKLEAGAERIPMDAAGPQQAHLFIVNPFPFGHLFRTHPPTDARVERLQAMTAAGPTPSRWPNRRGRARGF